MLSTHQNAEQFIGKYKSLKQSLQLPLKINLYFTFLQASLSETTAQKNAQNFNGFSALFYPVFLHLSKLEKAFYLYSNIEFIKSQYDRIQTVSNSKNSKVENASNIKASGQISESKMGLTFWSKVQIYFSYQTRKLKIATKNRKFEIDLRLYLVRKSKKFENTLVFEAISEIVTLNDRKISLFFKATVFQQVYNQIFNCILKYRNNQLFKIAFQQMSMNTLNANSPDVSYIAFNSKSLNFLGARSINQFLNYKDLVLKKLLRGTFNFQNIYSQLQTKIEVNRNYQDKQGTLYKLETKFKCSVQQLKRMFLQKYKSQNFKYLIQSQQLEKSSNRYGAVYQKLLFETSNQSFKTIEQMIIQEINLKQVTYENQELVFQKGASGNKLDKFLNFLIVKVKRLSDENRSKLIVLGSFNYQCSNASQFKKDKKQIVDVSQTQQIITMFMLEFSQMIFRKDYQMENIKKMIEEIRGADQMDENQFITVKGAFQNNQNEEMVLDYDEEDKTYQTADQKYEQNQSSLASSYKCQLEKVPSLMFESVCTEGMNNQETEQMKNQNQQHQIFYLNHQFKFWPIPLQKNLKQSKRVCQKHFLYQNWIRKSQGGLLCKDSAQISEQKRVANYIIKNLGKRIFQQKGILNLSLPVTIFRPESHLESIARNLSFAPLLLQKASKMSGIQRLKNVLIYAISVTVSSISVHKPFNPILGETLQVWIDGCPVYLQQISHHPPIVAYYMIGRGYKIYGNIGPKVSLGFNSITGYADEPNYVQFDDGDRIQLNFGKMIINGIIIGQRTFNFVDKMFAIDSKNRLFYELKFGPEKKISFFSKSNQPQDYLSGKIVRVSEQFIQKFYNCTQNQIAQQLSAFQGIWNGKIYIDNKQFYDFATQNGCIVTPEKYPLLSDSSYRKDIRQLRQGFINNSQHQKQILQQIQRRDKSLRENYQSQNRMKKSYQEK